MKEYRAYVVKHYVNDVRQPTGFREYSEPYRDRATAEGVLRVMIGSAGLLSGGVEAREVGEWARS